MTDFQVVWRGPVLDATGYGTASREYVFALDKLGVDVKLETWSWGHRVKEWDFAKKTKIKALMEKPDALFKRRVLVYHSPPWKVDIKKERMKFDRIILNTVWETTKLPDNWMPIISKFDAVCVPSRFNIEAMNNGGVKIPVFLVPHGIDRNEFKPENQKLPFKQTDGKFVFLSVFEFQHRKNPETLLRAYWEEFTHKDNTALLIKTHWGRHNSREIIEKVLNYKKRLGFGDDRAPLYIISKTLGDKELRGIYRLGQAFVLPTRGEGVGLPFMEALASGIPVIATGWGGQMDFLNPRNSFLVDYTLKYPGSSMNNKQGIAPFWRELFAEKGQLWAEADIHDLKSKMRKAYENPELCKQKGQQGREDMRLFSWDRAGLALKEAIEAVISNRM